MWTTLSTLRSKVADNLNFFRVHLLFFTFTPLVFSAIFYAANGAAHVAFIDAMYACFSATTVCGLVTVDLSSLTGFQQALLFVLTSAGHHVVVSWVMVFIRRRYFSRHLRHIIDSENAKRKALAEQRAVEGERQGLLQRLSHGFTTRMSLQLDEKGGEPATKPQDRILTIAEENQTAGTLHPGAIRRTSAAPQRVDPNGLITGPNPASESLNLDSKTFPLWSGKQTLRPRISEVDESPRIMERQLSSVDIVHDDRAYPPAHGIPLRRNTTQLTRSLRTERDGMSLQRQQQPPSSKHVTKHQGLGGFPYPTTLLYRLCRKSFTSLRRRTENMDVPLPHRIQSKLSTRTRRSEKEQVYSSRYFSESFNALAGRNSNFCGLTSDELEELGGVEYRALNALLWILAIYHLATQILAFIIVTPYMSLPRWKSDFSPPNLHRYVPPVWYSTFQVMSAFTTSGMSLVDQSMVPFQTAYPLVFVCAYLILAGNLAFPCFLRFFIWLVTKSARGSHLNETLHFLLDHPRRCYFYLFPSVQTWLLLTYVICQNFGFYGSRLVLTSFIIYSLLNYIFFLTLDIGEPIFEAIPLGVRFAIGVLQATAVRAAGFATTSLSSLAPALLVFFVIVMYLGVYPIALSVHATNVYEEKSLGIFNDDEDNEPKDEGSELSKYYKYLSWHARKQLSFDMWWIGFVLFLLCIIERDKIQDDVNYAWFTIFALIFEIMSAYAGVGISLGLPYANYSFSGALSTPSKLILIAIMIRGRHRGLPVAIDRAVMLPHEFKKVAPNATDDDRIRDAGRSPLFTNGIDGKEGIATGTVNIA